MIYQDIYLPNCEIYLQNCIYFEKKDIKTVFEFYKCILFTLKFNSQAANKKKTSKGWYCMNYKQMQLPNNKGSTPQELSFWRCSDPVV